MITLDYFMGVHSYLEANGYCAGGIRDKSQFTKPTMTPIYTPKIN